MSVEIKNVDPVQIEEFMAVAKARSVSTPQLINQGRVYMPAEKHKTWLALTMARCLVSGLDVQGVDNLQKAWESVQDNKRMMVVSNHQSDADHTLKRYIFEELGYRQFADRLFYLGGLKMIERGITTPLMPGENILFVVTPGDASSIKTALRWKHDKLLTPEQVADLDRYIDNMKSLEVVATAKRERLVALGMIPVFYPEATRSRDPQSRMIRAPREVAKLIPQDDETFILPIVTNGPANIMTVQDRYRLTRTRLQMVIGKPYPASEIHAVELAEVSIEGSPATRADVIMARLAVLNPELVQPDHREPYQKLSGGYNLGDNRRHYSTSFWDIFRDTPLAVLPKMVLSLSENGKH